MMPSPQVVVLYDEYLKRVSITLSKSHPWIEAEILDLNGKSVYFNNFYEDTKSVIIPTYDMKSGDYLVNLVYPGGAYSSKLTIEL